MSSDDIVEITLNGRKYGRLTTGDWAGPFPYMTAELEHALDEIERLQRWKEEALDEIERLQRWKKEAFGLLKEWNQIADDVIARLDADDTLGLRLHDIVASELKRLRAERDALRITISDLTAEAERLRAAGDALVDAVERQQWSTVDVAVAAWKEASRG